MKLKKRLTSLLTVMVMAFCMVGIKASASGASVIGVSVPSNLSVNYTYSNITTSFTSGNRTFYVGATDTYTFSCSPPTSAASEIRIYQGNNLKLTINVPKAGPGMPSHIIVTKKLYYNTVYTVKVKSAGPSNSNGSFNISGTYGVFLS